MHAKNIKYHSAAIFMDVEKAFDKVWHAGLINSLIRTGLPTIYVRYIHSFISDRHMFFSINSQESPLIKMNFGVPQGSSLSPILFILYVSDIPKPNIPRTYISQFADDIKIYTLAKNIHKAQANLQKSLNQVIDFCGKRRISINEKKSFELVFRLKSCNSNEEKAKPILCHNTPIPFKPSGKFLGVIFDQDLSFKQHITTIATKATTACISLQTLHGTNYGPSQQTLIRLFNVYVRPLFEYGHIALITAHPHLINKWEHIQTKYIRRTLNLPSSLNNDITRNLANQETITNRILHRARTWYTKTT